jgi:hypothetical protein
MSNFNEDIDINSFLSESDADNLSLMNDDEIQSHPDIETGELNVSNVDTTEIDLSTELIDDDDNVDNNDGWKHDYNNFEILLTKEDPVEKMLTKILKEEIRHIERVIMQLTINGSLNEIVNLFLSPLIPVIVGAVNASASDNREKINNEDAAHFIRCIIALHIYRVTPSKFFQKESLFPLAKELNQNRFQKVLYQLNKKRQSMSTDSKIYWDKPFSEDPSIRDGEDICARINRQFFIPNVSIISTDDDHLRL